MFKKILKNTIVRYAAAVIAVGALAYLLLAPLIIQNIFPQYDIVKKYLSVSICTDLPPDTPSDVFLPISCVDVNKSRSLACISESVSKYVAPAQASDEETFMCPLFVSAFDEAGKKNTALAVLPIEEHALRIIVSATILTSLTAIYVLIWVLVRTRKRRRNTSEIVDQNTHL